MYTFIVQRQPAVVGYFDQVPYAVALVELDEQPGLRLTGRVVDIDVDDVRIGMRVAARIDELPGGDVSVCPVLHPECEDIMTDPLFDLSGKIALVTGGSRGLGYQMVKAFAERGADCVIASRKLDNCEAVAEEVRAHGPTGARRPGPRRQVGLDRRA